MSYAKTPGDGPGVPEEFARTDHGTLTVRRSWC